MHRFNIHSLSPEKCSLTGKGIFDTQSKFKGDGGVLSDILNVDSEKTTEPYFQTRSVRTPNSEKRTIWQKYGPTQSITKNNGQYLVTY